MNKYAIIGVGALVLAILTVIRRRRPIKKRTLVDLIGNTPLVYLKSLSQLTGKEIYAKCEFMNPCGSMKDRTALALIREGMRRGQLDKHLIYEGTSGSTGISLTQIGNTFGYQTKVFLPDDLAQEKYDQLTVLGAELVKVRPVSIVDKQHFCKLAETSAQQDGAYYADQFHNIANYKAHHNTGREIYEQTNGLVDCFVMSAGTGGAIAGVSQYLKLRNKKIKVVLADPQGSSLKNHVLHKVCYTSEEAEGHRLKHPFDTVIEGVGQNRLTNNYLQAQIDYAYTISDADTIEMSRYLIAHEGLFVGGSSAMNCVATVNATKLYPECQVFVTILCDSGQRYLSKFYNSSYLQLHSKV